MMGKAPEFFSDGKGAGFLSDIRQIRKNFSIQLQKADNEAYHRLKLVPANPTPELSDVMISVTKTTFQVDQVVTHNAYGDETRIVLSGYQFNIEPDDALFTFNTPDGVDAIQIDQP